MPNLIEQLNQIKGLSDEALAAEMAQPSGVTPPYLVMTELNRRKDMRQRYEGELARKQKSTTVVEDLMSAGAPSAGMPPMASMGGPPAMGGAGLPAAVGQNVPTGQPVPAMGGVPGFAAGGLVDYASIEDRYNDKLSSTGERQKRAQALALLSAGAAMMGGGSNTLANIGAGINAGVGSYTGQLEAIDNEEMETLRGLLDVQRLQYGDAADLRNYDQREREMAQNAELARERLNFEKKPAAAANWEYRQRLPEEEQKAFDAYNTRSNPATAAAAGLPDDIARIEQQVANSIPELTFLQITEMGLTPDQVVAYKQQQIIKATYESVKRAYGQAAANQYLEQSGMSEADLLTAAGVPGADAGAPVGNDPLSLR